MKLKFYLLIFSILLFFVDVCNSADFKSSSGNNGEILIFISGDFEYGDEIKFKKLALLPDRGLVIFESRGGNLVAGIEIGKAIRLKGFDTIVLESGLCASSCALAWLGGVNRYLGKTASVGFHAAYRPVGGQKDVASVGNARVGAYAKELGLSDRAIDYITTAQPDEIQWLTAYDAKRVGINVDIRDFNANTSQSTNNQNQQKATKTIYEIASEFFYNYQMYWSQDNSQSIAYMQNVYAEYVNFYGSSKSKNSIIEEKIKFANRWPVRNYVLRPYSVVINCNNNICNVSGIVDWNAKSYERNANSSGSASTELIVDLNSGYPKIISENGKVLSRN